MNYGVRRLVGAFVWRRSRAVGALRLNRKRLAHRPTPTSPLRHLGRRVGALHIALLLVATQAIAADVFRSENLVAWCIVPFDAKKRGPQERAEMLMKLGIRKLAYDYRAEHIPTFDAEVEAMKRHGIEFTAWWFPGALNDEAKTILAVIERHKIQPQLWITGGGGPVRDEAAETALIESEAARLRPIAEAAQRLGCKVALYNHGGWFGEPENQIAIIARLERDRISNVGVVYNFHHGHEHIARFPELFKKMQPHLLAVNLNGMVRDGDKVGKKILGLGLGDQELGMMRVIQESGWDGPVGIINHLPEADAEVILRNNLRGLEWLRKELAQPGSGGPRPLAAEPRGKLDLGKFGKALNAREGGVVRPSEPAYRKLPLTIECWARLRNSRNFNILVASDPKASAAHWELYSYAGVGDLSLYLPGRGGEYRSGVPICDDRWHQSRRFWTRIVCVSTSTDSSRRTLCCLRDPERNSQQDWRSDDWSRVATVAMA